MWFRSLLASWKSWRSRSRLPQPRPARRSTRLVLEELEDRSLPSSYSAANVSALIADINAANKAGGANTITLTAPTTSPYVLTAVDNGGFAPNGLPAIAAKDNLTIIGNSDTIERSTASGTPAFRLFDVAIGGSLTLQNMNLQDGYESYSTFRDSARGGAIYNLGALTLSGVTVANNQACAVSGGSAYGGGIWSNGSLTLENGTLLEGNYSQGGDGGPFVSPGPAFGGAVYVAGGTANISNTIFTGNSVRGGTGNINANAFGGAFYVAAGQVTLTNSTVNNNSADLATNSGFYPGYGGGLYIAGGTVTLTNNTVESNTATYGGGVYVAGGTVSLSGDTVDSNSASYYSAVSGGGLYIAAGTVTLTNCTVASNTANGYGGGIYIASGATVYIDPFTLAHVINNTAATDPNIDGTYIET